MKTFEDRLKELEKLEEWQSQEVILLKDRLRLDSKELQRLEERSQVHADLIRSARSRIIDSEITIKLLNKRIEDLEEANNKQ